MTKILKISPDDPEEDRLLYAADFLIGNRIFIYPTDTVYGLGCSIDSPSVERIFEIKKRNKNTPLSIAFSSIEMAAEYAVIGGNEKRFMMKRADKPYTFIVRKTNRIPDVVTAGKDTAGVRIPDHPVIRGIIKRAGIPVVTTSANLSGEAPPTSVDEIADEIKGAVELIIDSGPCRTGRPSRVVDLHSGKILRG